MKWDKKKPSLTRAQAEQVVALHLAKPTRAQIQSQSDPIYRIILWAAWQTRFAATA